jgi:4-carboxymuconolactone decarboxylase
MVLANHPVLAMAYDKFAKHILMESSLPVRPRELVVLRVAWLFKSEYEWHYHVGYGLNAGLSIAEIAAVVKGPEDPIWNEADRAVLRSVDELKKDSRVSDETWATLARTFDRCQLMDLIFMIGNYVMLSWAISSFGVQLEEGVNQIGFDLETGSGPRPAARYKPGEVDDWIERNAIAE